MALIEQESALTLHSCISETDNLESNEPKNSIATGPLYVHTEFKKNWLLLPEDVVVSNLMGD